MRILKWTIAALMTASIFAACGGRSDDELRTAAEAALRSEPTTANVQVEVTDAVATLSGEVPDDAAKARASELAKVEGIQSVKNDVTVAAAPPPVASPDDASLRTKIEEALKANNCVGVSVDVRDGVATLNGSIDQQKGLECLMAAKVITNDVENKLKFEN